MRAYTDNAKFLIRFLIIVTSRCVYERPVRRIVRELSIIFVVTPQFLQCRFLRSHDRIQRSLRRSTDYYIMPDMPYHRRNGDGTVAAMAMVCFFYA